MDLARPSMASIAIKGDTVTKLDTDGSIEPDGFNATSDRTFNR